MKLDEYILGRLEKPLQVDVEKEALAEEEQDNGEQEKVCIHFSLDGDTATILTAYSILLSLLQVFVYSSYDNV